MGLPAAWPVRIEGITADFTASALKDVRVLTAYLRNGFGKVRYLDVVPGLVSAVIRKSFTPVPALEKAG
jgi:hypothetical protein